MIRTMVRSPWLTEWWPRALVGTQSSVVGRESLFRKAYSSGSAFMMRLNRLNLGLGKGWLQCEKRSR